MNPPWNSPVSSVQSCFIKQDMLAHLPEAGFMLNTVVFHLVEIQPPPIPKTKRPPESLSILAIFFAVTIGSRCGNKQIPVPSQGLGRRCGN